MKPNEIIDEIHRVRAEHAEECGYDVDVMFARMREGLDRLRTEGWKIVSLPPRRIEEPTALLREEPPKA
jgi:hypothetical protein